MRIKKTSETRAIAAQVVNTRSDSTKNAYACDYANKAFGGTILWANPNPTAISSDTTITFNSSDYDYMEILTIQNITDTRQYSTKLKKGLNGRISVINASDGTLAFRNFTYVSDTQYTIGTANNAIGDGFVIPIYVIGYKTGLFN